MAECWGVEETVRSSMWLLRLLLFLGVSSAFTVQPNSTSVRFIGRHAGSSFDWVGTGVELSLHLAGGDAPLQVSVDLDPGGEVRFAVFLKTTCPQAECPKRQIRNFLTSKGDAGRQRTYVLLNASDVGATNAGPAVLTLMKATENMFQHDPCTLYAASAAGGAELVAFPPVLEAAERPLRLDVWGDSDSAAYGVDGRAWAISCETENGAVFENFADGWVHQASRMLGGAEFHTQAVSGIGVVKNAAQILGHSIACYSANATLPELVGRSLFGAARDDWDFTSFVPDVVVVYIGGNDYANIFPPSNTAFASGYAAFVDGILGRYKRQPPPPVVHICNDKGAPCCPLIETFARGRAAAGDAYFLAATGTAAGCDGHRNVTQQLALAKGVAPVIRKAAARRASKAAQAGSHVRAG